MPVIIYSAWLVYPDPACLICKKVYSKINILHVIQEHAHF